MTDDQSPAYTDGPNTHHYRTFGRGSTFVVVTVDYADGDRHTFHVPAEVVNDIAGKLSGGEDPAQPGADGKRGRPASEQSATLAAIEATAAAEQRLRERIEVLPGMASGDPSNDGQIDHAWINRNRVLALLDAPSPASPRQGECGEPVALYGVAYGEQYDPCTKPKGHDGNHDPTASPRQGEPVAGLSSAFLEAVTTLVDAVLDRPLADPDDDAMKAARAVLRTDPTLSPDPAEPVAPDKEGNG